MPNNMAVRARVSALIVLMLCCTPWGSPNVAAALADDSPFVVSNVDATPISDTNVVITWNTSERADRQVEYGTTTAYGTRSKRYNSFSRDHSVTLRKLSPGLIYHFRLRNRDAHGVLHVSGDYTFQTPGGNSDTTGPQVAMTSPKQNQNVSGTISLAATATDDTSVAGVQFQVDGADANSVDTSAPYAATLNTTTLSEGAHAVRAVATDTAGNSSTSASVTILVDNGVVTSPGFYVSPNGSPNGDGSADSPWDLETALNHPASVQPGDTIWLRGGTYRGGFVSWLRGTSDAPVTLRQYRGERAILDGNGRGTVLTINGHDAVYWGFEVTSTDTRRVSSTSGSTQPADWRKNGIQVYARNTKLINLVVHDNADGIGFWKGAVDSEIYGCVTFNNGWLGPDRGHGHGIYIQNETGTKKIRNVISWNNFATGMKAYGQSSGSEGIHFDGIISFENGANEARGGALRNEGILAGTTDAPQRDIKILNSYIYAIPGTTGGGLRLGYQSIGEDVEIRGNVVASGQTLALNYWNSAVVEDNSFFTRYKANNVVLASGQLPSSHVFRNNSYFDESPHRNGEPRPFGIRGVFNVLGGGALSFNEWRNAYGWDQSSSYREGAFIGSQVAVLPNEYEPGRAHVAIYNWSRAATVAVDLSGVLQVGDSFEIRSVQDFFGNPVVTGTYNGQPVAVPMNILQVATAHGYDFTAQSTSPEFGAFVVIKH